MSKSRNKHSMTKTSSFKYSLYKYKHKKIVLFVVMFFTFGSALDHLTTACGLSMPAIVEKNPTVLMLVEQGVWHWAEVLTMVITMCYGVFIIKTRFTTVYNLTLILMAATGSFRFYAGVQNMAIIMKVLF